jgi:hypothetical protein
MQDRYEFTLTLKNPDLATEAAWRRAYMEGRPVVFEDFTEGTFDIVSVNKDGATLTVVMRTKEEPMANDSEILAKIRDELRLLREGLTSNNAYDPRREFKDMAKKTNEKTDKELLEDALEGSEAKERGFKAKE